MKINQKIEKAMVDAGYTQTSLALAMGVSQQAVQQWISGETKPKEIKKLSILLKVSIDFLFDDADSPQLGINPLLPGLTTQAQLGLPRFQNTELYKPPQLGLPKSFHQQMKIPVVGHAQLGDNGHWVDLGYPVGLGDGFVYYSVKDSNAYALKCVGDSMSPRIKDGEFVVVEPGKQPHNGDEVLVKSTDGRVMVKTLLFERDGKIHLQSVNNTHPMIIIPISEIEAIHPLGGIAFSTNWVDG